MNLSDYTITEQKDPKEIYGLRMLSSDRTQAADIQTLSALYQNITGKPPKEALPYFIITQNYNEQTRQFDLFVGSLLDHKELESLLLPSGIYAKSEIKSTFSFLLGQKIGKAKRDFYRHFIPQSSYSPLDITYEYHTEKSLAQNGTIEIFYAVQKKQPE